MWCTFHSLHVFYLGIKREKPIAYWEKCVGLRSERADAGTGGRSGHAGSQHTEMVDAMPGSV